MTNENKKTSLSIEIIGLYIGNIIVVRLQLAISAAHQHPGPTNSNRNSSTNYDQYSPLNLTT